MKVSGAGEDRDNEEPVLFIQKLAGEWRKGRIIFFMSFIPVLIILVTTTVWGIPREPSRHPDPFVELFLVLSILGILVPTMILYIIILFRWEPIVIYHDRIEGRFTIGDQITNRKRNVPFSMINKVRLSPNKWLGNTTVELVLKNGGIIVINAEGEDNRFIEALSMTGVYLDYTVTKRLDFESPRNAINSTGGLKGIRDSSIWLILTIFFWCGYLAGSTIHFDDPLLGVSSLVIFLVLTLFMTLLMYALVLGSREMAIRETAKITKAGIKYRMNLMARMFLKDEGIIPKDRIERIKPALESMDLMKVGVVVLADGEMEVPFDIYLHGERLGFERDGSDWVNPAGRKTTVSSDLRLNGVYFIAGLWIIGAISGYFGIVNLLILMTFSVLIFILGASKTILFDSIDASRSRRSAFATIVGRHLLLPYATKRYRKIALDRIHKVTLREDRFGKYTLLIVDRNRFKGGQDLAEVLRESGFHIHPYRTRE